MNTMNRQHILLGVAGLAIVLYLAVYLMFAHPLARDVKAYRNRVDTKRNALRGSGWPLNYEALQKIADTTERKRAAAERHKNALLDRTTSLFRERILRLYETPLHFQNQVSRLDYQEEFYRIERKLTEHGIKLDRDILGISEESVRPQTYQLVLQLWTLEAITDAMTAHNLRPLPARGRTNTEGRAAKGTNGAALTVLEPETFYLKGADDKPYLLHFAVRLEVEGAVQDVYRFLATAHTDNAFFTVTQMELHKALPEKQNTADLVEAALECGAFYIPDGSVRIEQAIPEAPRVLPPGA
ncbi:MAG: hypothetical protein K9N51_04855 [Candidatus Pacebacteria bacterium]|nr:hypothetical protein [Candidatus Paceibacterota bacterium]